MITECLPLPPTCADIQSSGVVLLHLQVRLRCPGRNPDGSLEHSTMLFRAGWHTPLALGICPILYHTPIGTVIFTLSIAFRNLEKVVNGLVEIITKFVAFMLIRSTLKAPDLLAKWS